MAKNIQENIIKFPIKPLFADDVIVITPIKAMKINKKVKKEGHVVLLFVDMLNQQPISKIIISESTAESLKKVLIKVLNKLEKDLASDDIPKPIIKSAKTESTKYIS